jgi:ubiquinone/menaquinone biosynthesis C-methylase UbiE
MTRIRYLHGYSPAEQRRLHRQARTFAPILHRDLQFPSGTHLLEVGCGAGAQTAILLRNHPRLRVTAVDYSPDHLAAAQRYFARHQTLARNRLHFCRADATDLPFDANTFDAALSVWLLEHTPDPLAILREVRRVLRKGGRLHLREVFNASVYIHPRCPAMEDYWAAYNALQYDLAGNPNIGPHLGNLLRQAGFADIRIHPEPIWLDARRPALRRHWVAYWHELLLSAAPNLLAHKRIPARLLPQMKKEIAALQSNPHAIFFFSPIFGYAEK